MEGDQEKQRETVTSKAEGSSSSQVQNVQADKNKQWLSGSYWLVRVLFIRALGAIYCK